MATPTTTENSKANISTFGGDEAGYLFVKKVADGSMATAIAQATGAVTGFDCLGFITSDGITENESRSKNVLRDINDAAIFVTHTEREETRHYNAAETTRDAVKKLVWGEDNVQSGVTYHSAQGRDDYYTIVEKLVRKDGTPHTVVTPMAQFDSLDEVKYSGTEARIYGISVTCTDVVENGVTYTTKEIEGTATAKTSSPSSSKE